TSAFSTVTFDNSPLNRVTNVKEPGTAWAAAAGNSATYDVNSSNENVQQFTAAYIQGSPPTINYLQANPPVDMGAYPANTLYKLTYTDENGKKVIEYVDRAGQLILKKVQLDNSPSVAHSGWICTYFVYDDFGLLRYELQPEAV